MLIRAYAKVNISLDVVGKREDGYHLLKMIMQNIDLYDEIEMDECESGIVISCDKAYVPTDNRNLAYKAADLFMKEYGINAGVSIKITKNIPVAAGLAGGSTDAAAVLKGMRDMFRPQVSNEELMKTGVRIGADVPYCIQGGTALCEGIGEIMTVLPSFKNHIMVVVKPPFGVSTRDVYQALDISKIMRHPRTGDLIKAMRRNDLEFVCKNMRNVLENVTLRRCRSIRDIKNSMVRNGAVGAMMSGSGPTVFGFFDDMMSAQRCYEAMKRNFKEVYITRTI